MPAIFVHLSDIHFGQERDDSLYIHNDVKEQLISDAATVVSGLPGNRATGILVTGDVAYAGKKEEYASAGEWLDRLANAVGCETFRIQMVPGNHDIDRDLISGGMRLILNEIKAGGSKELEAFLNNKRDRETMFDRFDAYSRFCEGYNCPLDATGRYATNLHVELAPARAIRFVRMNSALLCSGEESDEEPELMFGARQFTIPRTAGEEIVVLIHHPLRWLKDTPAARDYLRSRARVFISGHEHNPKVHVDDVEAGSQLLMLAAGATVPPKPSEIYAFTYNVIQFDWDREQDALAVTIYPRVWNPTRTRFESDDKRLGGANPRFVLASPNFRASSGNTVIRPEGLSVDRESSEPIAEVVAAEEVGAVEEAMIQPKVEGYERVLLRFFRDLSEGERLRLLIQLDAVPSDSSERMTQTLERQLLDWLIRKGRIGDVEATMAALIAARGAGDDI
jgi:GTPase-associated adaptor domain/Calcineurin-like phosphoesterase